MGIIILIYLELCNFLWDLIDYKLIWFAIKCLLFIFNFKINIFVSLEFNLNRSVKVGEKIKEILYSLGYIVKCDLSK